jgi:hypothetical protein
MRSGMFKCERMDAFWRAYYMVNNGFSWMARHLLADAKNTH